MPTKTNLFNLGAKSHADIKKRIEGEAVIIKYDGHYYTADKKQFVRENFRCELTLVC